MTNFNAGAIALCPGVHPPDLTQSFVQQLESLGPLPRVLVFPSDRYPAYSSVEVLRFLHERLTPAQSHAWTTTPIMFIGFSAGVVGAMGAAVALETLGGNVRALMALDGWGVPVMGRFPTYRLSHDYFTHWSSAWLGAGADSFYANPEVAHLDLWRSPQAVRGQWIRPSTPAATSTTALEFLWFWIQHHFT
ncbi:MAG: hypothetical protein NW220_06415 [Leptolyngbyaceae cyanobacterium bins.349]|nr:hypothetical protein [Leptolyngbyaceae cyanobacterium bins.349]